MILIWIKVCYGMFLLPDENSMGGFCFNTMQYWTDEARVDISQRTWGQNLPAKKSLIFAFL